MGMVTFLSFYFGKIGGTLSEFSRRLKTGKSRRRPFLRFSAKSVQKYEHNTKCAVTETTYDAAYGSMCFTAGRTFGSIVTQILSPFEFSAGIGYTELEKKKFRKTTSL